MATVEAKLSSADCITLLRNRYSDQQKYVFMEQVASGTGWRASSWIDAMVICLWPSEGLKRIAFEIKVSRTDFINELQAAQKNQWVRDTCHEFYYVAPASVIKQESEIPQGCGWLEVQKNRVIHRLHAQLNKTPDCDDLLVASLARSMQKEIANGKKIARNSLVETDPEILRWKLHSKALNEFVLKHKSYFLNRDLKTSDEIVEKLCELTRDKEVEAVLQNVDYALKNFQNQLLSTWKSFTILTHLGLNQADEHGQLIGRSFRIEKSLGLAGELAKASLDKYSQENKDKAEIELKLLTELSNIILNIAPN